MARCRLIVACNHILIVFHLYCCSTRKLSKILLGILFTNLARSVTLTLWFITLFMFFCEFHCYLLYMIRLLLLEVHSMHELSTINMLYFLKKFATAHPYHNAHLSTMATFFCPQGGHCGGVRLLSEEITIIYFNQQFVHAKWNLTTASVKSNWKGVSKKMKIYLNLLWCSYVLSYGLL